MVNPSDQLERKAGQVLLLWLLSAVVTDASRTEKHGRIECLS